MGGEDLGNSLPKGRDNQMMGEKAKENQGRQELEEEVREERRI